MAEELMGITKEMERINIRERVKSSDLEETIFYLLEA